MSQFIYDEAKVRRNEVNLSILRMVYAEVVLGVPVDWRTMEIQTKSKMTPLMSMTAPCARKFLGEGLGKKATDVEINNDKLEWSETSSDDSDTGCDPHVRKEIEYSFKYSWVENAANKEPKISNEAGKDGEASKRDAVPDEGVNIKQKPAEEAMVSRDIYLELLARHEKSLEIMEILAEEVEKKESEIQECLEELWELKEKVREKDQLIANLMS